jgi:ribosomal protein L13
MLPKNKLQSNRMARLKIYPGPDHQQQSQLGGK